MTLFEFQIFGFTIAPSFYGLMYVIWLFAGYYIIKTRNFLDDEDLDSLLFYIFLWIIIWGRLGYVIFYNPGYFLFENPLEILQVWKWWMSFHGGLAWVIIASALFAHFYKKNFYEIVDEIAYVGTIGIFFGRIGNYFNKELLWFQYNGPLAVIKDWVGYFPAPIMEAILEWLILFVILSYFYSNRRFKWQIWALFLILYAFFRILVESGFRTPDAHIGYFLAHMSLWTILSLVMFAAGIFFYGYLWYTQTHLPKEEHHDKKHKHHKK